MFSWQKDLCPVPGMRLFLSLQLPAARVFRLKWWGTWCRLDDGGGCGFVGEERKGWRGEKETEITEKEVGDGTDTKNK